MHFILKFSFHIMKEIKWKVPLAWNELGFDLNEVHLED